MANPFINSSFTLRPSTNDRDKPELTLRQTAVSRIPNETTATGNRSKGGRAFKRQRLFMDRWFDCNDDDYYGNDEDQYISEDEYDTPIIRRRVSSELFPFGHRISAGLSVSEDNYWKSRCLGMQNFCDESKTRLRESEEDQRQLRQRIRALEEQLLLQTCGSSNNNNFAISIDEADATNDGNLADRDRETDNNVVEGKNNRGECNGKKKQAPPALVVEIKENHQAVSSCFYLTDSEGLNESYEMEMEEDEDISMDDHFCDGILGDIDDDRNDINMNQRRG
jgi:hypothetical protein